MTLFGSETQNFMVGGGGQAPTAASSWQDRGESRNAGATR